MASGILEMVLPHILPTVLAKRLRFNFMAQDMCWITSMRPLSAMGTYQPMTDRKSVV